MYLLTSKFTVSYFSRFTFKVLSVPYKYIQRRRIIITSLAMTSSNTVRFRTSRAEDIQGVFKKKKDPTFAIKTLFYNILCTVPIKVVPSASDTPFPTLIPLLECFLERTVCDGAQFSYRIFLNLRMFKKIPNFLNSAPTSKEGTLQLLSAPSGRF